MSLRPRNPDLKWYTAISNSKGMLPRCPFASVHLCPRYYQSLSLLKHFGSTAIDPVEDEKLHKKWSSSYLWPATDEQATSVMGFSSGSQTLSRFCPEVTYDQFGHFASFLADYADTVDREAAHARLAREETDSNDWRWYWSSVIPLHYSECVLYSPLAHRSREEIKRESAPRIFNLRPGLWGISLDLHALFARVKQWFQK